jgi:hypothetical protein
MNESGSHRLRSLPSGAVLKPGRLGKPDLRTRHPALSVSDHYRHATFLIRLSIEVIELPSEPGKSSQTTQEMAPFAKSD